MTPGIYQGDKDSSFWKKTLDKLVAWLNYIVEGLN
jgi:hypothetical protein